MKAAVIKEINKVKVCQIDKPILKKGYVLLKIAFGGFCGPTEMCIIEGVHPRAKFPLVFCHEFSGIVEDVNKDSTLKKGDAVVVNPLITCDACYACKQGDSHICKNLKLIGIDCDGGLRNTALFLSKTSSGFLKGCL